MSQCFYVVISDSLQVSTFYGFAFLLPEAQCSRSGGYCCVVMSHVLHVLFW